MADIMAEKKAAPQTERAESPDTLTRIRPTREGADIIRALAAKGEDIIKRAAQTGEAGVDKTQLGWLTAAIRDLPGSSVKAVDRKGYHYALIVKKSHGEKETWYVRDASDNSWFDRSGEYTLVNKNNPQMIAIFDSRPGSSKKTDSEYLLEALDEARRNAGSQKKDPAGAKAFDLTRKRPIGYLCFNGFDKSDRGARTQYYEYSHALPELLKSCGYDMVCPDDKNRIQELKGPLAAGAVATLVANPTIAGIAAFAATPHENDAKLVEQQVEALYKQGVRDFYLNFLTHGDKNAGMKGADGDWLKGEDLKKILLKYKDCTFAIDATGCEGGGLIGMMREFKDVPEAPEGRVGVFVHTKENFSIFSHDYQALLTKGLKNMADGAPGAPRTYGEAHLRADKETKRITNGQYDPEFWKSMPGQKSLRTAKNEAAPNPLEEAVRQYFAGYTPSSEGHQPQPSLAGLVSRSAQRVRT